MNGLILLPGACVLWGTVLSDAHAGSNQALQRQVRRPVAMAESSDGNFLYIANHRSGSVSIIDSKRRRVAKEYKIGRQLSDLTLSSDGRRLFVLDEAANQIIILNCHGPDLEVDRRISVSNDPVSIRLTPDGRYCSVACLWAHKSVWIKLAPAMKQPVIHSMRLPFAPRLHVVIGHHAIVADAFGGRLATIDMYANRLLSVSTIHGHNIGGLAIGHGGQTLWLAHQILNPHAHTTADDIHWGNLITNNIRQLNLSNVCKPAADPMSNSRLYEIGDAGHGAGDPNGVVTCGQGTVAVALGGTGELAIGNPNAAQWTRIAVGARPTAVLRSRDRSHIFVANTLSNSISVVDLSTKKVETTIELGKHPELEAADRGELLFHDSRLSHEGWLSCHSCHTDGHSNGQLNDNLSDGSYGTPKRVLSLLGVKDTGPWAWNGSMPTLRAQIKASVHTTLRGRDLSSRQIADLEAYLLTLKPPPPVEAANDALLARGQAVFATKRCTRCHQPPTYTSKNVFDVGLADEVGLRAFNPPSLRGVGQGTSFFHDGRAKTLTEVFTRYHHEMRGDLSKDDLAALLTFLRSL